MSACCVQVIAALVATGKVRMVCSQVGRSKVQAPSRGLDMCAGPDIAPACKGEAQLPSRAAALPGTCAYGFGMCQRFEPR